MLTRKTKPGRAPLGQLSKPWSEYNEEERNDPLYVKPDRGPKKKEIKYGKNGYPLCKNKLHEMSPENIYSWKTPTRPYKTCKRCHSIKQAEGYQKRKARKAMKEVQNDSN